MGLFDSLMAGAQVDPQLGAAYGAMPDPRRQAMLRQLGIQAGDPGAQVTGNWMDSLGQQPGGPQRPMSPVPNPSPAASAAQPTGPAPRNPPGPSGQGAPPMPTVAGNAGPMLPGIGTPPPMGQAPSGAPVPASSPLATAGPQGGVPSVGGNAGPMTTPLSGFGGLTPPGDIPAGLRQMVTNPETGRPFTPQQYVNHTVGVLPFSSYDAAMMGPMFQDMYNQHQALAERSLSGLGQLHQALTGAESAGTTRALGMGDLGLRSAEALGTSGMPGVPAMPGQIANRAQAAADAHAVHMDALNRDAQAARTVDQLRIADAQAGRQRPTGYYERIQQDIRRSHVPVGNGTVQEGGGATNQGGQGGNQGGQTNVTGPQAQVPNSVLNDMWLTMLNNRPQGRDQQLGTPTGSEAHALLNNFVSQAMSNPTISASDIHRFLAQHSNLGINDLEDWFATPSRTPGYQWMGDPIQSQLVRRYQHRLQSEGAMSDATREANPITHAILGVGSLGIGPGLRLVDQWLNGPAQ